MDSDQKVDQIKSKIESEQVEDLQLSAVELKYRNRIMDGTFVYGPPMNKRKKYALAEARAILAANDRPVLKEIFEFTCPIAWAFHFSVKHGWTRISLQPLLDEWTKGTA